MHSLGDYPLRSNLWTNYGKTLHIYQTTRRHVTEYSNVVTAVITWNGTWAVACCGNVTWAVACCGNVTWAVAYCGNNLLVTACNCMYFFFIWRDSSQWARGSSFTKFLDHTQRSTTVGRTPLDKWSARRRDLYLTKHNSQHRHTSMPPVGFEPTISAGERPLGAVNWLYWFLELLIKCSELPQPQAFQILEAPCWELWTGCMTQSGQQR